MVMCCCGCALRGEPEAPPPGPDSQAPLNRGAGAPTSGRDEARFA